MELHEMIQLIQRKKELSGIDHAIVHEILISILAQKHLSATALKPSQAKHIIKEVRAQLRAMAGQYASSVNPNKQRALLENGKVEELLKTNRSTAERLSFYPELRKKIVDLQVSSILDLGCGLNPLALAAPLWVYYAADINRIDLALVQHFFQKQHIQGKTFVCDLRAIETAHLPRADLCLLLKVFDVLEKRGHTLAEKIIQAAPCRFLLISFSTKTLSGKPMRHPQRGWIERLLHRLGYPFTSFASNNEIFYLAEK